MLYILPHHHVIKFILFIYDDQIEGGGHFSTPSFLVQYALPEKLLLNVQPLSCVNNSLDFNERYDRVVIKWVSVINCELREKYVCLFKDLYFHVECPLWNRQKKHN